jgi:hypothetical protein
MVMDEFLEVNRAYPLSHTNFSVRQMLHLLVVRIVYQRHLGGLVGSSNTRRTLDLLLGRRRGAELRDFAAGVLVPGYEQLEVIGEQTLTPKYLEDHLVPYLLALEAMQQECDELLNKERRERVVIAEITQKSPITIGLQGLGDAINAIKEIISPWRRRHAKKIAELNALDLEIEIKKKQAEAMKAETELGTKREASKTRRLLREKIEQEIERDKIENARNRFELDKS